jgi:Utp13 specific WD40 associated domain
MMHVSPPSPTWPHVRIPVPPHLQDGDYRAAARLAFQLRHPGRLLDVLRRQPGGPAAALGALQGLVGQLDAEELATALQYCR